MRFFTFGKRLQDQQKETEKSSGPGGTYLGSINSDSQRPRGGRQNESILL
jgi:hypothetical protein